jgi:radical SAM superfamily enzyme YgiQ (UPF0313 family)
LLGRGCPFECSYCCNHALKKKASGNYIRLRSTDNIINEIKDLAKKYPENKNIYLEIETVNINRDWAIELCSKLFDLNKTLDEPLRFGINLRITPHENYEHIFSAFQKSNFKFINIGLESGSERIRRDILRRNYSNSDVINAVKSGRRHNLQIAFYNIIGIPGETIRDHQETIRMNRLCQPDWIMATIFFPYPGTDLYALCRSKGYMKGTIDTEMERCRAVLDIPDFSKKQIQSAYEWFYYNVYKNHKPLHVLIVRTFVAKLRRWPRFFRIYLLIARQDMYRKLKSFLKDKSIFKD